MAKRRYKTTTIARAKAAASKLPNADTRQMNAKDVERQLEITKELGELLTQQLQAMEDESFLGRDKNRDDISLKRSLRMRALRRELANMASREKATA